MHGYGLPTSCAAAAAARIYDQVYLTIPLQYVDDKRAFLKKTETGLNFQNSSNKRPTVYKEINDHDQGWSRCRNLDPLVEGSIPAVTIVIHNSPRR